LCPEYPIGFYVYRLIDPRNGAEFYIGKGQRGRAWQHERRYRAGKPDRGRRKDIRIGEIVAAGLSVVVEIAGVFDDEADALDLEFLLVERNPTLTNVLPGGAGSGLVDSPLRAERRRLVYAEKRRRIVKGNRIRQKEAKTRKAEAQASEFSRLGRHDKHRAQIDSWLASHEGKRASHGVQPRKPSTKASKEALAAFRAAKPVM
jgi:hypothetical protein